jgi:hypothetical protein
MDELTDTNVAGRKARVTTAMVFMDALSLLAARLMLIVSEAISIVALMSLWTTLLNP